MDCILRKYPKSRHRTRTLVGEPGTAIILIVGLLSCVAMTGCNHNPTGLIPVSGKLTLDGGAWPKSGQITFSPVKPAAGHPTLPQAARIEDDGSFAIKTEAAPGLVPGDYGVAITCLKGAPDGGRAGKSAVAERYRSALTSGLKLTIPEGSGPVFLSGKDWDIKSK